MTEFTPKLRRHYRHLRVGADHADLFGQDIPTHLLTDYECDDVNAGLSRIVQRKYTVRARNIRRAWNRIELLLPELMSSTGPRKAILEMSTAHGAVLEVLRHFGHEVVGNDFANMLQDNEGAKSSVLRPVNFAGDQRARDDYGNLIEGEKTLWPYKNIIDSIGIPMRIFDAGQTPYPVGDKEFDVTICLQAIEHYCHPDDWMVIVEEFCRITRNSIVILLNPPARAAQMAEDDYLASFNRARNDLRQYNSNGFRCVHSSIWFGEALGFKLMAI